MSSKPNSAAFPSPLLAAALAALAAFLGPGLLVPSAPHFGQETRDLDGTPFPKSIVAGGSRKRQALLGGASVRDGPRAYGLGIYLEEDLLQWGKKWHPEVKEIVGDRLEAQAFCSARNAKTLFLKFHRGVSTSTVAEGLASRIVGRVGEDRAARFEDFLADAVATDRLEEGSELLLTCHGEDLFASTDGREDAPTYVSRAVCPALFHAYLGSRAVSPEARDSVQRGFEDHEFWYSVFALKKRKAMLVR